MPEAEDFLLKLEPKARYKILYNISKTQYIQNSELLKKIDDIIWEFRTLYNKTHYRLLAFWEQDTNTFIVCTHAFIKKTKKTPIQEIQKAKQLREEYFKNKEK